MRDPNRIPVVLDALRTYWEEHPDWRLCQLVVNVAERGNDPFYVEDDAFLANLFRRQEAEHD